MRMIFVDAGAWFSLMVSTSESHERARRWWGENRYGLIATDYVIDETLTLLRSRRQAHIALELGRDFFEKGLSEIYYLTPADIRATWGIFHRFSDKAWSFTDCSSKLVIEKLGLETAFAFDQHFQQFGVVQVAP